MITNEFSASTNKRLGQFFSFLACVCFGLTCWAYASDRNFIHSGRITPGTVIEVQKNHTLPTIKFVTSLGKEIVFQPSSRSSLVEFVVGKPVEVLYNENAPDEAKLNTWFHLWSNTFAAAMCFMMLSVFAILTILGKMRWGPLKQTRITIGGS